MKPKLIILNQTVTQQIIKWLTSFAAGQGPIEIWSGNFPEQHQSELVIRRSPTYQRHSALSRLLTWGQYTLVAFWRLLRIPRQTPIFVTTNPPFAPLLVWCISKLRKTPYVLLEWDIYPQITEPMGLMTSRHLLYRIWYQWHRRALLDARAVITIGESMAEELCVMANNAAFQPVIIPTWVDVNKIQPLERERNSFAHYHNLGDKLVLAYSGNLGATHAIESILELAHALRDQPEIVLFIIGEGSKRPLVEGAVQSGEYPNLRLLDRLEEDDFALALAAIDLNIVTLAAGYERFSMPSKTITALAAGNAILAISQAPNDLAGLAERHQCGRNFAPDDVSGMASWVQRLVYHRDELRAYQQSARQTAVQHYSEETCTGRLSAVLHDTLLGVQTGRV